MKLRLGATLVAMVCLLSATACESVGRSGGSVKDVVSSRSIERARLHSASDIKDAYDSSSGDADEVLLLFLNACLLVEEDKEAGGQAIAYLSRKNDQANDAGSPTGVKLSQMASEGLRRIWERPELIRSYCGGDGADFSMGSPEVVDLSIKDTQKVNDTTRKYFLWSTGKDNASPVSLRSEGGRWYVDEWSSLQTGVTAR
ncbi:MAG: hypothetical protein K8I27_07525 [Planctomycetes bacterium]|nr:hypothetical protein [Planctomycetota bacterium]